MTSWYWLKHHYGMKKLQSTGKPILDKTSLPVKKSKVRKRAKQVSPEFSKF